MSVSSILYQLLFIANPVAVDVYVSKISIRFVRNWLICFSQLPTLPCALASSVFLNSFRRGNEELTLVGGKLQLIMFFLSVSGWHVEMLWSDPSCRFESFLQVGCERCDGPGKEAEDKKNLSLLCQSVVSVSFLHLFILLFHSASI